MLFRLITFLSLISLLNACASAPYSGEQRLMIQGQMISLKDGSKLPIEVENYATGKYIIVQNNKTGERLKGEYILDKSGTSASTSTVTNNYGFQTGQIHTTSGNYAIKAVLTGNKGTVMNVTIYLGSAVEKFVEPYTWEGHNHYGEAVDNHGTKYQIQMSGTAVARDLNAIQ